MLEAHRTVPKANTDQSVRVQVGVFSLCTRRFSSIKQLPYVLPAVPRPRHMHVIVSTVVKQQVHAVLCHLGKIQERPCSLLIKMSTASFLPQAHSHMFSHLCRQSKHVSSHKSRRDTYFWNRCTPKSNNAPGTTCPFTTMCCTAQYDDDKRVSITCMPVRKGRHDLLAIPTSSSMFHARGRTIKRAEFSAIFFPDPSSTPQAACRALKWP